jgi:hypothetical protein
VNEALPSGKVSAARHVAHQACEAAFGSAAERRACRLGNELMLTALDAEKGLGRMPKGFRETQVSRISCAQGSLRTVSPNKTTRVLVCCPSGPGHWKSGRCRVGMRMKATWKRA